MLLLHWKVQVTVFTKFTRFQGFQSMQRYPNNTTVDVLPTLLLISYILKHLLMKNVPKSRAKFNDNNKYFATVKQEN